jgi:hypothetical protein
MTCIAWLAITPYQGMPPRISRISNVPIRATHTPAAGPPIAQAPTIGPTP